jgi:hypothetical protein
MAHSVHPVTGVALNVITVKRPRLSKNDAVTVFMLKMEDVSYTDIVQYLGTNAHRVGEVLRGEVWPEARQIAIDLKGGDLFTRH